MGGGGGGAEVGAGGGERSRLPHLTDSSTDEGQTALLGR